MIVSNLFQPENILVDAEDNAKLADLGESIELHGDDDIVKGTKGTPGFLAPELVDLDSTDEARGMPVDIWALGVTLYGCVFGDIPFTGETRMELYENIAKQPLIIPKRPPVSDECRDMIARLLEKDPKFR